MRRVETEESERPLVLAAQRGEAAAMQILVARDGRWVRAIVGGLVSDAQAADDIVQKVWTTAWERIQSLREAGCWRAWLYRLARSAAMDAGREAGRRRRVSVELRRAADVPARQPQPQEVVESLEMHQRVLGAIRGLPAIYREPFILRHLEDWNYQQIARTLGISAEAVETRLVRARRLLRESLADGREQA